jgi:hypothetical protein
MIEVLMSFYGLGEEDAKELFGRTKGHEKFAKPRGL